ncbi:O-antigen export system ATP-binding protein RfbB [Desulfarculales bacterium]
MSQEPAIEVQDLVKRFRREMLQRSYGTWKSLLLSPFAKKRGHDYVTVLDGLSFQVAGGSTLAVIGQNGSGKSTLLKIMAGIYKPDQGSVTVRGRMSSLIELGAGFHPEFSGRENVYLNGTILGLSKKEIGERFDHIGTYSGLGDYIDAPVRTYSSGMYVRLGFAVAVNVDPDVLLVDEVLAVGDEAFAQKCEDKINQLKRSGKTIVLVTHDLGAVKKYADEVIWLDGGCLAARGEPLRVIDAYRQKVSLAEDDIRRDQCQPQEALSQKRWGDGQVLIEVVRVLDQDGAEHAVFQQGQALTVEMDYRQVRLTAELVFGVAIHNAQEVLCYGTNTHIDRADLGPLPERRGRVQFNVSRLDLVQGTYLLDVAVHARDGRAYDYIKRAASFAVRSGLGDEGVFRPPHVWQVAPRGDKS